MWSLIRRPSLPLSPPSPRSWPRLLSPSNLTLAAVVAIAGFLRLYNLTYAQYRYDDDTMFTLAAEALRSGSVPFKGMHTSLGPDNGPTALYLTMVSVAVFGTELGATAFMALVNLLAVALTYPIVRSFFGPRVALLSTVLFATNSWAVVYSRRAWLNAALPVFSLLFLGALLALARRAGAEADASSSSFEASHKNSRGTAAVSLAYGLAASALVQVHLSALSHLFTYAVGIWVTRLWRRPIPFLLAVGGLVATAAPYVLGALLPGLLGLVRERTTQGDSSSGLPIVVVSPERVGQFLYLLTSRGYQTYANQAGQLMDTTQGFFLVLDMLVWAVFALGTGVVAWRALRGHRPERAVFFLLLIWLASPVLLPGPGASDNGGFIILPHHLPVTLPGALVVLSIGFDVAASFLGRLRPGLGAVAWAVASASAASHLAAAVPFFAVEHEYWPLGDYGTPLAHTLAVAERTVRDAGGATVMLGGHEGGPGVLYRVMQRRGLESRFFEDRNLVLTLPPGREVVYLTTDDDAWSTRYLRENFPSSEEWAYVVPGAGWTYRLFRLMSDELDANLDRWLPRRSIGQFDDLAIVESARVVGEARPGGSFEVYVRWRFLREPEEPYMTRLMVRDSTDRVVFTHEEVAYPARYRYREADYPAPFWRNGDSSVLGFFNRFAVPVPPDVSAGTYNVTMRMLSIIDWEPVGKAVSLGQVRVLPPDQASPLSPDQVDRLGTGQAPAGPAP